MGLVGSNVEEYNVAHYRVGLDPGIREKGDRSIKRR